MRPSLVLILVGVIPTTQLMSAVRGEHAAYVGGTASLKAGVQGTLDVADPSTLLFHTKDASFRIPYQNVTSLEFGQKIGRRVGTTVALGVTTLGIGALPILFSKKKRHYLTIGYTESGANQAAIFELAKDTVRSTLVTLAARTGKTVERDDTADMDRPQEPVKQLKNFPGPSAAATPTGSAPAAATVVQPPTAQSPADPKTAAMHTPTPAVAAVETAGPAMTNLDVIKLVRSGVSQDIVLAAIRNCDPRFQLHPAATDELSQYGVSDTIIKAMAARTHGR